MSGKEWFGPSELKELLHYDSETGVFIWKKTKGRMKAGAKAGSMDKYGYLSIGLFGLNHSAHRLAWLYHYGEWPKGQVDHRNMVITDNSIANLRVATMSQQRANQRVSKLSTTGVKGVSQRSSGRWYARANNEYLGTFDTIEQAREAYATRAKEVYGEFARVE